MKVLAWYIDLNDVENMKTVKYPYPIGTENRGLLIMDTQMVSKEDDSTPTLVQTFGYGQQSIWY
jgi:hypothetical protein